MGKHASFIIGFGNTIIERLGKQYFTAVDILIAGQNHNFYIGVQPIAGDKPGLNMRQLETISRCSEAGSRVK